jgi:hypothetical protein
MLQGHKIQMGAVLLVLAALLVVNDGYSGDPDPADAGRPILSALPVIEDAETFLEQTDRGPIVPGLHSGIVPQGLTYLPASTTYVVSAYVAKERKKELASCLLMIPAAGDTPHKTVWLLAPDGSPYKGHVGGVAYDGKQLWVASGKTCYSVALSVIQASADGGEATLTSQLDHGRPASFVTFDAGVLWVGTFDDDAGAAVTGYRLAPDGTPGAAEGAAEVVGSLTLPKAVQGMCFTGGHLVLSSSYGGSDSKLRVYRDPRPDLAAEGAVARTLNLTDYLQAELVGPPMSEGVVAVPGGVAVVFENAAHIYLGHKRTPLVDHIRVLPLK